MTKPSSGCTRSTAAELTGEGVTETTETATSVTGPSEQAPGKTEPFSYDGKAYDPLGRPFHRVRARTYDRGVDQEPSKLMTLAPPPGRGYDCGCRSPNDYRQSALFDSIVDAVFEGMKAAMDAQVPGSRDAYERFRQFVRQQTNSDFEDDFKRWLANTVEGAFFRSYLKYIPSWAPVARVGYGPGFSKGAYNVDDKGREAEVEVEGVLTRSYLSRHHRPYTQWSTFYHWSFHVNPSRGFKHLIGEGDLLTPDERNDVGRAGEREASPAINLYLQSAANSSFECLLDLGAISKPPGDQVPLQPLHYPSILFDRTWPFWPQSGDWFWAAGRYVYDCTHATSDEKQEKDGAKPGLHPTLINPTKAFAVARYEAFQFEKDAEWIPATRFLFFATRKGGYWNFDGDIKIGDQDYEFLVDLPPLPEDFGEFSIGRTPEFDWNTIVVRPRLLKAIEFAPFGAGADSPLTWWKRDPVVQLVRPEPGKLPRMLRVKVPLSELSKEEKPPDAYAFVLTCGWYDPAQVARVRKVAVQMPNFTMLGERKNLRYHVCINGRWVFYNPGTNPASPTFHNVSDNVQTPAHPGPDGMILHLPEDGQVVITSSGTQRYGYGEFMETKPSVDADRTKDRRLELGGIIEMDEDTLKSIRDALQQALNSQLPDKYWKDFKKVREILNDPAVRGMLNAASQDLFGQRHVVDWNTEVDAIEADPTKANTVASGIAREMKVFPFASFNKPNQPMGLIDHQLPVSNFASTKLRMVDLIRRADQDKEPVTTHIYRTRKAEHSTDSGFVYMLTQTKENEDYVLECKVTVSPPDAGGAKPVAP
jgi:hypothetical protein